MRTLLPPSPANSARKSGGCGLISASRLTLCTLLALLLLPLWADFAVYGDTQTGHSVHKKIAAAIAKRQPGAVFHAGDLSSRGSDQKHYDKFFSLSRPITSVCPIYPARGNHDGDKALFLKNFPHLGGKTYYSVEHDSLLFVILDTNLSLKPRSAQFHWLRKTLSEKNSLPRILVMHHPIFSSGYHGGRDEYAILLPSMLESGNVKAVFSGHDHNYERLERKGITYFVTGGAGGTLRPKQHNVSTSKVFLPQNHYLFCSREGSRLKVTAYGLRGEVLDRAVIRLD